MTSGEGLTPEQLADAIERFLNEPDDFERLTAEHKAYREALERIRDYKSSDYGPTKFMRSIARETLGDQEEK